MVFAEPFLADLFLHEPLRAGRGWPQKAVLKNCAYVRKMSGLSQTERAGCTKILNLMSKDDLLSLSDTVTNKMIVVENITGMFFICGRKQRAVQDVTELVSFSHNVGKRNLQHNNTCSVIKIIIKTFVRMIVKMLANAEDKSIAK